MIEVDRQSLTPEEIEIIQEEKEEALISQNELDAGLPPGLVLEESDFEDFNEVGDCHAGVTFDHRTRSPIMMEMEGNLGV